jgi:hypothetical protein
MGPSWPREGGRGNRKSTQIFENIKNVKVKMQTKKKRCFWNLGAIFSNIGGLNGWAFTKALSTNIIKVAYKTEHKEKQ